MWIWDTSIAVINAHFPAHQGEKKARDEVFQRLISELDLGGHANMESLQSFDHLIWAGCAFHSAFSSTNYYVVQRTWSLFSLLITSSGQATSTRRTILL
jgi:hypothetical protein